MKKTKPGYMPQWIQHTLSDGFAALQNNNIDHASACCQKIIQAKPDLPEAHFLVGLISLELGDRKTAIQAFGSVTTLDQHHGPAWAHLAYELFNSGQINRADIALSKAVEYDSKKHQIQHLIGNLFTKLGDNKNAEIWQANACTYQPYKLFYHVNHASSLLYLGRDEDLKLKLDGIFQHAPENAQSHFILSTSRRADSCDHINELNKLQQKNSLSTTKIAKVERSFLNYALGKEYEDQEQWKNAFTAFSRGATAKRSLLEYDEQTEIDAYKALEKTYTAEWLSEQEPSCQDDSPIFVVGQPRTGTTLIERIITSHSQVESAGELQQLSMSLRRTLNYTTSTWFSEDFI